MKKENIIILIGCFLMEILTINFIILTIIEIQGGFDQLFTTLTYLFVNLIIITAEIAMVIYGHSKEQHKEIEVYAIIIPFAIIILSMLVFVNLADSLLYGHTEIFDKLVAYPYLILILTAIIFYGSLKKILDRYYSEFE